MQSFSHESKCPNQFYRHDRQPVCDVSSAKNTWNPWGTGLLHENFDIPIIFLSQKDEWEKVVKCYKDFNIIKEGQDKRALCSIEINSFMAAAANTEVCMRRSKISGYIRQMRFCDPLKGRNIYGTLFPREIVNPTSNRTNDKDEKIIIVSARLDTTSMFDGEGLGAMDSLASYATLISTAHFLRKIFTDKDYERSKMNVLFMLFNGESYDYIGSQRLVYDMKKDAFPAPSSHTRILTLDNVEMLIDLGALDSLDSLKIYHLTESSTKAMTFKESIDAYNTALNLNLTIQNELTNNIPPVSAQMFLRENVSFPTLVFATDKPKNQFYHSIYDDANNLNFIYHNSTKDFDKLDSVGDASNFSDSSVQVKIRNIATAVGLGIYDLLMTDKKYSQNMIASSALVDEFLYCFLISTKCQLFQASLDLHDDHRTIAPPPQRYVSVNSAQSLQTTGWSYHLFGFILGEKNEMLKENCTTLPFYWIPGSSKNGECRYMTQNFSTAMSPAFDEEENYNFKSNLYSTWTESTWNDLSARMFLQSSSSHDTFIFIIGLIFFILSFVTVSVVKSRAEILFGEAVIAEQYVLIN